MGGSTDIIDTSEVESDSSFLRHTSSLAICLVSGGMDSCVTAAIARAENDELGFLHISYGQRTEAREQRAFSDLADHFGVRKRLVTSIGNLKVMGGLSSSGVTKSWCE